MRKSFKYSPEIKVWIKAEIKSNFMINSSESAFVLSRIGGGIKIKELESIVSGMVSDERLIEIVYDLVEKGIVGHENQSSASKVKVKVKRDYSSVKFNEREIDEYNDLSYDVKKEILYIYYYGKNLNYYRLLNIPSNAGAKEVSEAYSLIEGIVNPATWEGLELGSYISKINIAFSIVKKASTLLDANSRKQYDEMVIYPANRKEKRLQDEERMKEKLKKSALNAAEHKRTAVLHAEKGHFQKALNEIVLAMYYYPENGEYLKLKNEYKEKINNQRYEKFINILKKDQLITFDDRKLRAVLDKILSHSISKPDTYILLAEILFERKMAEMAINYANRASSLSKDSGINQKAGHIVIKSENFLKKQEENRWRNPA